MDERRKLFEDVFDAASAITDQAAQEAFVRERCAGVPNMIEEILGMLDADRLADDGAFLRTVAGAEDPRSVGVIEQPGSVIGRYKLLQQIGEGGYGVVYMAEQVEPVRRRVALKIIKLGMDTREVIARFEAERQALAMMDHPNIARVLDAGCTDSGRPYFVMELVRGVAITSFCDQENLSARERLELFVSVCQAIQHAHLKGVIHRDIKPSNVMVTLHDGNPVAKVIDFGIAKATQQRLTEKTLFTQYQQFIGTPAYMSPEQAEMSGLDIDTRTDVYALGVMLYELLVGAPPFDSKELASAGYDEIRRRIREEEPDKPSTRLQTLTPGQFKSIAKQRSCDPVDLSRVVRGDLDWIVMTALEKDRRRRYESPSLLAADVARYLEDQAIEARPPSLAYRLNKFAKRHRIACVAGGLTALSLILGLGFSIYGLREARRGFDLANANLTVARENETEAILQRERADEEAATAQRLLYPAMLKAATEAARNGRRDRAVELLATCPETARGWEWRWASRMLAEPAQTYQGHSSDHCVFDVRFDQSGTRLVTGGEDNTAITWNVSTSTPIARFSGHEGSVILSTFLSDQKNIVTIGGDKTLRVSSASSGDELGISRSGNDSFSAAAISDDGRHIVTAEEEGTFRLWSQGLESQLAVMADQIVGAEALAVNDIGTRIAAVTKAGTIVVWNGKGTRMLDFKIAGLGFNCAAFSPGSEWLATGNQEGNVSVWDLSEGTEIASWQAHSRATSSLKFSPDGSLLATAGWEGGIAIRKISTSEELGFFVTANSHVHAIAFSPDGQSIVATGEHGSVMRWSLNQLPTTITFSGHDELVFEAVATSDGKRLVSVGADGTLRTWDIRTGVELTRLMPRKGSIYSVDVSRDGSRMVSRGSDGVMRLWELPSGCLLRETPIDYRVRNVRFSRDGSKIAAGAARGSARTASQEPTLSIWDAESGQELLQLAGHLSSNLSRMDFHPEGTHLVTTSQKGDGSAIVWDLESGKIALKLQLEGDAVSNSVAWSLDGANIYTGHSDGRLCYWDATTGQLLRTVYAHGEMVGAIEVSADGRRLVTCAWYSSEVKLWHAETGELQLAVDVKIPGISDVGFAMNDTAIVAAGMNGGLKLLSAESVVGTDFNSLFKVEQLADKLRDLEHAIMDEPIDSGAFRESVEHVIDTQRELRQHTSHGSVASQSSHQPAAAALDSIATQCYEAKRFDDATWTLIRAIQLVPSDERNRRLQWIEEVRPVLESSNQPAKFNLQPYVGDFEERQFFIRNEALFYRHLDFGTERKLILLEQDRFLVDGDESMQLVFSSSTLNSNPTKVSGVYFAGGTDVSLRTE